MPERLQRRELGRGERLTLEDETGLVNLVLTPQVFARFREARDEVMLLCEGVIERQGDVVNVRVQKVERLADHADAAQEPELG